MLAGVANSVTSVSLMGSCKPTEWNSSSVRWGGGSCLFTRPVRSQLTFYVTMRAVRFWLREQCTKRIWNSPHVEINQN